MEEVKLQMKQDQHCITNVLFAEHLHKDLEEMKLQMKQDQPCITIVLFAEHLHTDPEPGRGGAADELGSALYYGYFCFLLFFLNFIFAEHLQTDTESG